MTCRLRFYSGKAATQGPFCSSEVGAGEGYRRRGEEGSRLREGNKNSRRYPPQSPDSRLPTLEERARSLEYQPRTLGSFLRFLPKCRVSPAQGIQKGGNGGGEENETRKDPRGWSVTPPRPRRLSLWHTPLGRARVLSSSKRRRQSN